MAGANRGVNRHLNHCFYASVHDTRVHRCVLAFLTCSRFGRNVSPAFEFLCAILSPSIGDDLRRRLADTIATPPFCWTEFKDLATGQLVAAAVVHRLDQNGLAGRLPDAVSRYFGAVYRLNRIRNIQINVECMAIAAAMNEIDVVPVFFKGGGALLAGLYDDPATRIMSDLDILVPAARNSDCVTRLLAWGYRVDGTPRHPRDQSHAVLYLESGAAPVDLHRDIIVYPYQNLLPVRDVIALAIEHNRQGVTFAVPSPTHQAIINAAHAQLHHNHGYIYGRLALRSLLDMSLICRRWSDDIDWREVEDRFRRIGARTALDFHRIAASELFGPERLPTTGRWRARLSFKWARFLTGHVALLKIGERPLHAYLLLRRELSDTELRRRLSRNIRDPRWWSRHLATFRRGGTAAAGGKIPMLKSPHRPSRR
jgi:Uncharacterised nucleotidyltransferase